MTFSVALLPFQMQWRKKQLVVEELAVPCAGTWWQPTDISNVSGILLSIWPTGSCGSGHDFCLRVYKMHKFPKSCFLTLKLQNCSVHIALRLQGQFFLLGLIKNNLQTTSTQPLPSYNLALNKFEVQCCWSIPTNSPEFFFCHAELLLKTILETYFSAVLRIWILIQRMNSQ